MKTYVLLLFIWEIIAQPIVAQPVHSVLDEDVVFQQVLIRWLTYPDSFNYFPIYGRVYAGFQINGKGRIENIVILSPGNTKSGFEYQVRQALKHMPSLNPRYAGDYALPVAFCYRNRSVSNSFYKPVNKLDENRLGNRLLLSERTCLFDWSTTKTYGDPQEVWGFYKGR